jgi:hypothetical protein
MDACEGLITVGLEASTHFMMIHEAHVMAPCLAICDHLYANKVFETD